MLTDRKILGSDFEGKNIKSLPDRPSEAGITAADLKAMFDRGTEQVITERMNGVIDDLSGVEGACNVGTADGATVQEHITATTGHVTDTTLHVERANILTKDNTEEYTPQGAYAPATKAYVDSKQVEANSADMMQAVYDSSGKKQDVFAYVDTRTLNKVEKVSGMGLSEANFTAAEKQKLATVEEHVAPQVQADWNEIVTTSPSHIQNKPEVVNNLTAGGITSVLSAEQGKQLATTKADKTTTYTKVEVDSKLTAVPNTNAYTTYSKGLFVGGYKSASSGGEVRNIFIGTGAPSGGKPGDIFLRIQ